MIYLDANVILRYLLEDHPAFFEQSKKIIESNEVFIKNEVLAEVVYVLNKTYDVPKEEVKTTLQELLQNSNISVDSQPVVAMALEIFESRNIDFVDALLRGFHRQPGNC